MKTKTSPAGFVALNRMTALVFITIISFSNLFGQTDLTKIKTFDKDSVCIGYNYVKYDSTICNSTFDTIQNREIFWVVDKMAVFGNGPADALNYIQKNLKYPPIVGCEIYGRVYLRFIVETDGTISNITVLRSFDAAIDTLAIDVIKNMPVWKPGECNGMKVPVYCVVPVRIYPI